MQERDEVLDSKLKELRKYLPDGRPIGLTFSTSKQKYYYDTVTGKIVVCQDLEYRIIQKLLEGKLEDIRQIGEVKQVSKISGEIIYVFLTIFLYLLKCPQSLIL